MKSTLAVVRRELRVLRSSPWDIFALLGMPVIAVVVLLMAFSGGTPRRMPVAAVDQDGSTFSRAVTRAPDAGSTLHVAAVTGNVTEALTLLRRSQVEAFVVIPSHTERELSFGRQGHLVTYLNGLHSLAAGLIANDFNSLALGASVTIETIGRAKHRTPEAEGIAESQPFALDVRNLYNPRVDYEANLADPLIPAVLVLALTLCVVSAFGREFRDRTVPTWIGAARQNLGAANAPGT